jgi:hypothetical protein
MEEEKKDEKMSLRRLSGSDGFFAVTLPFEQFSIAASAFCGQC